MCLMGDDPTEWHPARMLRARADEQGPAARFALIIFNQPLRDVPALETLRGKSV